MCDNLSRVQKRAIALTPTVANDALLPAVSTD